MAKKCNIEKWLREKIKAHKQLAITNKGNVNSMLHCERVFAYKSVLIELGLEEIKPYSECVKEPPIV